MKLPDGWRQLSLTARVRVSALLVMSIGIYVCFQAGYPAFLSAQKSREIRQIQHTGMMSSWQRLLSLPASTDVSLQPSVKAIPFSPVSFQRAGARLKGWLPSGKGGEMVLETAWQQVPSTFVMLAERDMRVVNFTLTAENGVLRLTLQLVSDDEH